MRTILTAAALTCVMNYAVAQQAFKNAGPKPFCLTTVGEQGFGPGKDWSGMLCVMGHETMVVDPGPLPGMTLQATSGAGYFQADDGSYIDIRKPLGQDVLFEGKNCYCALHVSKVEWDHSGVLTGVSGMGPMLITDEDKGTALRITSDHEHPKIANGNLYLTLDGRGQAEYSFKIKFGKLIAIATEGEHKSAASGNVPAGRETAAEAFRSLNSGFVRQVVAFFGGAALLVLMIYFWQLRRKKKEG